MLGCPLPEQIPDHEQILMEKVHDILVECGFQEVINYSLTSEEKLGKISSYHESVAPVHVANPMSREQEYLRTSLRPGILHTLFANQRHEQEGIKLFEIGKIYLPREADLPDEVEMLIGVLSGSRWEISWLGESGALDFFDAKGAVEALMDKLRIDAVFEAETCEGLHSGRTAVISCDGDRIGVIGELHPKLRESFELIPQPVALFEIEVKKLLAYAAKRQYSTPPRFPSSVRDIAIVVDNGAPAKNIEDIINSYSLVSKITLFDIYTGNQIQEGKKSLAYRIVYQSLTHTLTDEEVDKVEKEILDRLSKELGALLRS
jgi:phenylalanyl-tRNA synthetase beta chain